MGTSVTSQRSSKALVIFATNPWHRLLDLYAVAASTALGLALADYLQKFVAGQNAMGLEEVDHRL